MAQSLTMGDRTPSEGSLEWATAIKQRMEAMFAEAGAPIDTLQEAVERAPDDAFLRSLANLPLRHLPPVMAARAEQVLPVASLSKPLTELPSLLTVHGSDMTSPTLSVGYAMRENGLFEVGVRLQNPDLHAWLVAREVAGRLGVSQRIGILRDLTTHASAYPGALGCDPLTLGSSIGISGGDAGSLGCFARDSDGRIGILSCSHILARGGMAGKGAPVFHPSPIDDAAGAKPVGHLDVFEDMLKSGTRPFDAAWAVLAETDERCANTVPAGHCLPSEGRKLTGLAPVALPRAAKLAKIGRSSAWTTGKVVLQDVGPLNIYYPALRREVAVGGLIEVAWETDAAPFSMAGDSGSMAFLAETMEPVGLVIAGGLLNDGNTTRGCSYISPIRPILTGWNLSLL